MIGRLTMLGAEGIEERDATTLSKGGASGVTLVASFATFEEARAAADDIGAVGAYVAPVRIGENGVPRPANLRETIRYAGPTIDLPRTFGL